MHTVWFPAPVALLFRRVVNVVFPLSISHHYFRRKLQLDGDTTPTSTADSRTKLWGAFPRPAWYSKDRGFVQATSLDDVQSRPTASVEPTSEHSLPDHHLPPKQPTDEIHRLIRSPVLYDPLRTPRYPIALCHGLYGFDVRGPSAFPILQMHYWTNVLNILRQKVGAEVIVTSVPSTGSIESRAKSMDHFLREKAHGRGINFMAHSMGGLDCRHLITHIKPTAYTPLSLTSIATPHRGSPFMDWCEENTGIGRLRHRERALSAAHSSETNAFSEEKPPQDADVHRHDHDASASKPPSNSTKSSLLFASLPSSFTTLLLSVVDSPAYANLTSAYLDNVFNPATPDDPSVKYFSVAGRVTNLSIWHPLWLPKMVLDGFEEKERERLRDDPRWDRSDEWGNDALVTVQSARWGEFLGIMEGCDHWDVRGARGIDVDILSVPGLHIGKGGSKPKTEESARKHEEESWSVADWRKFVRMWKREEKEAAKDAAAGISQRTHEERRANRRKGGKAEADEVVKSSTDKVSAVFDWIIEQVPSKRSFSLLPSSGQESGDAPSSAAGKTDREKTEKQADRSDLATKMDLERFYIALCRKLYDEGL
ncbi:Alpha/Beta hydrolase protein [Sparassis latifolia]|uniref:DUF676 domain-containing protein n=1 Tax=Sparassis crispa TaxID=139825 RepID=A0A401GTN0_9APHY|nr:hypothetical protein SCP_0702800 [Sparassis crispa]GBE85094.1 hypothetical protein SCP_0702800 [Sparassis crispa]